QNLQLVLVDDGSGAEVHHLCDALAAKDERICVHHQQNAGVSAARNAGLSLVKGEYLTFVDADDFVEPSFVEDLVNAMQGKELAICGIADRPFEVVDKALSSDEFFAHPQPFIGVQYVNFTWNKMYLTELIQKFHIRFDPSIRLGEDAVFLSDYFPHCHQMACFSKKLYHYCDNAASAMRRYQPDFWKWEETLITRQWALFAAKAAAPAQQAQIYQWLYTKLRDVFSYYLVKAPKERQILREIQNSQVYKRFITTVRGNMGFDQKTMLKICLWRRLHTTGIVIGHWMYHTEGKHDSKARFLKAKRLPKSL
ncbi:MAG: glycosyltransferase family 2 protein, partial [Clostridia bacterium]